MRTLGTAVFKASASCALLGSSSLYIRPSTVGGQKFLEDFYPASTMNNRTAPIVARTLSSLQAQEISQTPFKNRSFSSQPFQTKTQTQSGFFNTLAGGNVTKVGGGTAAILAILSAGTYFYCEKHPEEEFCATLRHQLGIKKK